MRPQDIIGNRSHAPVRPKGMSDIPSETANPQQSEIDQLFSALYEDLRTMAHHRLSKSEPITLLDTTSLVHESYLRFVKAGRWSSFPRSQFLAYASHAMRSVIVDLVRRRRAERRGGGEIHLELERHLEEVSNPGEEDILRVNEALDELAKADARLAEVVEMRYFAGLEEQEIATSLGVTERTVRRDWQKARLMLSLALR
jgi:RNA polymerase sigma factor (TIGR02999 family)